MAAPLAVSSLGRTGLPVTRIGLGLAALGRPAYITLGRDHDLGADRDVAAMRRRTDDVLDAAFSAGVRYFDAARSYGRAEEFLAAWLDDRGVSPGDVTIGSKWGYRYTGGWRLNAAVQEIKDHSLAMFERQGGETMQLLDGHLRLYQVHSATLESGVLDDVSVMQALVDMTHAGIAAGLTVSGPRQADTIRRALSVDVGGVNPFTVVQATWNLLEPSVGPALDEASAAGWGVVVKEALANGRLAPRSGLGASPVLADIASDHGVAIDHVALAAALAQPWADVILSGAVSVMQLQSNVDALSVVVSESDLDRLAALAETPDAYWAYRSSLPWQ
jgi:aryl-alcohol dehydrogenase-like predicted oxidoreductase